MRYSTRQLTVRAVPCRVNQYRNSAVCRDVSVAQGLSRRIISLTSWNAEGLVSWFSWGALLKVSSWLWQPLVMWPLCCSTSTLISCCWFANLQSILTCPLAKHSPPLFTNSARLNVTSQLENVCKFQPKSYYFISFSQMVNTLISPLGLSDLVRINQQRLVTLINTKYDSRRNYEINCSQLDSKDISLKIEYLYKFKMYLMFKFRFTNKTVRYAIHDWENISDSNVTVLS